MRVSAAARPGEERAAVRWDEFIGGLRRILAERMKKRRPHAWNLCDQKAPGPAH